jgi:hypothetical protein
VHWDGAKSQNLVVQKFCTKGSQTFLSLPGMRDKTFLSTSNVIFSQLVQPTSAKKIAHVLLVVFGKILLVKSTKKWKKFTCTSWARNGKFGVFFEKNGLGPSGVILEYAIIKHVAFQDYSSTKSIISILYLQYIERGIKYFILAFKS